MSLEHDLRGEPTAELEPAHGVSDVKPSDDESVGKTLTRVISMLVDHPEAVRVDSQPSRSGEVFCVSVNSDDLGQLIGRQGRTARALRTLLDVRGSRDGRRYGLEILES